MEGRRIDPHAAAQQQLARVRIELDVVGVNVERAGSPLGPCDTAGAADEREEGRGETCARSSSSPANRPPRRPLSALRPASPRRPP